MSWPKTVSKPLNFFLLIFFVIYVDCILHQTPTQYETTVNERFERAKNTSSDFIENKAAASYAYDATWTIALALNKSLGKLLFKLPIKSRNYFEFGLESYSVV